MSIFLFNNSIKLNYIFYKSKQDHVTGRTVVLVTVEYLKGDAVVNLRDLRMVNSVEAKLDSAGRPALGSALFVRSDMKVSKDLRVS